MTQLVENIGGPGKTLPIAERPITGREFEHDAVEVLTALKSAFKGMIASLGVRRAVELRRALNLQQTLCWQIFKVVNERSVLAAGGAVPARASVVRFADAAGKAGVGPERVRSVLAAYEEFERLVERHAGDRTSFNSLVAGVDGLTDEWLASDLLHRRNIFRGLSHVLGLQVKTRFACTLIAPGREGHGYDMAALSGYQGLRMLRPRKEFRFFGLNLPRDSAGELPDIRPLGKTGDSDDFYLEEFCNRPRPQIVINDAIIPESNQRQIEGYLVRPDVGKMGVSDLTVGFRYHTESLPRSIQLICNAPVETLFQDVIIDPSAIDDFMPTLSVFLGNGLPPARDADLTVLEGKFDIERLGRGTRLMATPDVPRYSELVAFAAEQLGHDLGEFEVFRVRLELPVYQSVLRVQISPGV